MHNTTYMDWLCSALEADLKKPVVARKSRYAGHVCVRSQLLDFTTSYNLKKQKNKDKFIDSNGQWWQCLRKKDNPSLESMFLFRAVKVLFVGIESESDSYSRYI